MSSELHTLLFIFVPFFLDLILHPDASSIEHYRRRKSGIEPKASVLKGPPGRYLWSESEQHRSATATSE
jgi:hypothetical protein